MGCQARHVQRAPPCTLGLQKAACRGSGRKGIIARLVEIQLPDPADPSPNPGLADTSDPEAPCFFLDSQGTNLRQRQPTGPVCSGPTDFDGPGPHLPLTCLALPLLQGLLALIPLSFQPVTSYVRTLQDLQF